MRRIPDSQQEAFLEIPQATPVLEGLYPVKPIDGSHVWFKKMSDRDAGFYRGDFYLVDVAEGKIIDTFSANHVRSASCEMIWIQLKTDVVGGWQAIGVNGKFNSDGMNYSAVRDFQDDVAWIKMYRFENDIREKTEDFAENSGRNSVKSVHDLEFYHDEFFQLIDREERFLLEEKKYIPITDFYRGYAWVKDSLDDDFVHLIDKNGKKILCFKEADTKFTIWNVDANSKQHVEGKIIVELGGLWKEVSFEELLKLSQKLPSEKQQEIDMTPLVEPRTVLESIRAKLHQLFEVMSEATGKRVR